MILERQLSVKSNRSITTQSGVALVELALLLPLLVVIFIFGIDVSRLLGSMQVAGAFSRELVNQAHRHCSGEPNDEIGPCIEIVYDDLLPQANRVEAGAQLIVSVFRFNSSTNRFELMARIPEPSPDYEASRIGTGPENSLASDELETGVFQPTQTIIVGEVYVPFEFLFSRVPGGLFLSSDGFTYQTSMIAS